MAISDSTPPDAADASAATSPAAGPVARDEMLDTVAAQVRAIDEIVGLARLKIQVFDRSLADGGWNRPERIAALAAFLRRSRHARIEIIVHDTRWIETSAARFVNLLRLHGDTMQVWRTGVDAQAAMDPLVLVDGRHFVHRFHADQPRARLAISQPVAAKPLADRFGEIWAKGEPAVSGTVLGL
jgi:hypothetical protein